VGGRGGVGWLVAAVDFARFRLFSTVFDCFRLFSIYGFARGGVAGPATVVGFARGGGRSCSQLGPPPSKRGSVAPAREPASQPAGEPASEPRLDLKLMGDASGCSFRSHRQPRYIAVVCYSEKRRHAVFWSASCCICGGLAPLKATRIPNPQIPLGTRGLQRTRNSRALTPAFREALVPLVP